MIVIFEDLKLLQN